MAFNADEIIVGSGILYIKENQTGLYRRLGYTAGGVRLSLRVEKEAISNIRSFAPVEHRKYREVLEINFALMEHTLENIKTMFDLSSSISSNTLYGGGWYNELYHTLRFIGYGGENVTRQVDIPKVSISDLVEMAWQKAAATVLPVTLTAIWDEYLFCMKDIRRRFSPVDPYWPMTGCDCTITTDPVGLNVVVDDVTEGSPIIRFWQPTTSHVLNASSPQGEYGYDHWSDAGAQSHSIIVPSLCAEIYTAYFEALQYVVTTDPVGLNIQVDGITYVAPHIFYWTPGDSYTLNAPSPQDGQVYDYWSDFGTQEHEIIVPGISTTYTAYFTAGAGPFYVGVSYGGGVA